MVIFYSKLKEIRVRLIA